MNKHLHYALLAATAVMSIGAFCLSLINLINKPLKMGTIDTSLVIAEKAKVLAKQDLKAYLSPLKMRQVGDQIKEDVAKWAAANKVTLIAKGAVWSENLPDYTESVLATLQLQGGQL